MSAQLKLHNIAKSWFPEDFELQIEKPVENILIEIGPAVVILLNGNLVQGQLNINSKSGSFFVAEKEFLADEVNGFIRMLK